MTFFKSIRTRVIGENDENQSSSPHFPVSHQIHILASLLARSIKIAESKKIIRKRRSITFKKEKRVSTEARPGFSPQLANGHPHLRVTPGHLARESTNPSALYSAASSIGHCESSTDNSADYHIVPHTLLPIGSDRAAALEGGCCGWHPTLPSLTEVFVMVGLRNSSGW